MSDFLIRDIPVMDRPRERFLKYGASNISNEDLLSIVLKTGTKNRSVRSLALSILNEYKDISNLRCAEVNRLVLIDGIGRVKAIELLAAIELGRRVYMNADKDLIKIRDSSDIYNYFNLLVRDLKQEHFYVIYLDNKKNVIDKKLLYVGTINGSVAHPREIFKYAYLYSASFIICLHNHPSGDPTPSKEDILFTDHLIEIGKLNNIPVLDHIIIGRNCYYSFFKGE